MPALDHVVRLPAPRCSLLAGSAVSSCLCCRNFSDPAAVLRSSCHSAPPSTWPFLSRCDRDCADLGLARGTRRIGLAERIIRLVVARCWPGSASQ